MNPLKMLLLVIVSTGLACSAFAVERTRNPDTPAPAVARPADSIAVAPVVELNAPADASIRLASAAAVQYAAGDGNRIATRAAASTSGVAAPRTGRSGAAVGGSRSPRLTMPEPTEWMQLLCGLVVAGFIARRRTSLVAG